MGDGALSGPFGPIAGPWVVVGSTLGRTGLPGEGQHKVSGDTHAFVVGPAASTGAAAFRFPPAPRCPRG
ncbi:hypothetical protein FRAAL5551 [Frankia alni ACN14a]|uniref:Uncharacterized protein n=1 Tax=Frankia alni (strain DSM 45986 / CECT 9034 / ACN14a) TaxID=326424 RepID=Q0REC6_FRAAA|nr:hypothetical protein FRAAL5551 [Frankia alni ACN14a]